MTVQISGVFSGGKNRIDEMVIRIIYRRNNASIALKIRDIFWG